MTTTACERPGCLCGGLGHEGGRECAVCHGSGFVWKRPSDTEAFYKSLCDKCSGVGTVDFARRKPKPDAAVEPMSERALMQIMDGEP